MARQFTDRKVICRNKTKREKEREGESKDGDIDQERILRSQMQIKNARI